MSDVFRSGFVSIVGRPNSGKSTLVNRLVGEKISIVTDRPQTTRHVIRGVVTRPEGQIVFLDTPGVHKPIHRMNTRMMDSVRQSIADADAVALLVDASTPFGKGDAYTVELVGAAKAPKFLLLNKVDRIPKEGLLGQIDHYSKLASFDAIIPISARTGDGVERFVLEVIERLPEGPRYYPDDQPTDRTERALAEETIREKLIKATREELPYSTAVVIEQFSEEPSIVRIAANILVERESHKAIAIGKGGQLLKAIGTAARRDIEEMLGRKVYLELRVVVKKNWRDDVETLKRLGLE
ncbi:MAG TPA: GTPase Era [Terriglobia bacterium]|nr:GTPase Era [Terriglobia bacterium]